MQRLRKWAPSDTTPPNYRAELARRLATIAEQTIETDPRTYRGAFGHVCALEKLGARGASSAVEADIMAAARAFAAAAAPQGGAQ